MQISHRQRKQCEEIAKEFHLKLLFLFGSQARGDVHAKSDVDFAYLSIQPLSLETLYELMSRLATIFTIATDRIDMVDISKANSLLTFFIAQEGILLAGNQVDEDTFYRTSIMKHFDAQPLYELEKEYIRNHYAA